MTMGLFRFRDSAVPLLGLSTHDPSIDEMRPTRLVDSSFRAVIRVHDDAGNVIESYKHRGDFKKPYRDFVHNSANFPASRRCF